VNDEIPPLDVEAHLPFLARALEEDDAAHDLTAAAVVPADAVATADVVARASGVLAGLALAEPVFRMLDPDAAVEALREDGEKVGANTLVLTVRGKARAILAAERTVLNVLRRLGGVATLTNAFVEATMGTGARILDTRKTTPGWRVLEKYAVRCGGGENHRQGLGDAAMVKENHLYAAFGRTGPDSIREAIRRCRAALTPDARLYVEVEDPAELEAAAAAGCDVILLDGFEIGDVRRAVRHVRSRPPPRPELEVTGGVDLEHVEAIAATGVTRISVGALTHSAPALDLALRVRGASTR
jgi:nicotinate-nucleotide pyrophosphorylase (carboxylating)